MEINTNEKDGVIILQLKGNLLGEKDSQTLLEILTTSIEKGKNCFVADLEELNYINSTGLSVLISILTKSRNAGGNMCIANTPDTVAKLLHITKLEDTFPSAKTIDEAVEMAKS